MPLGGERAADRRLPVADELEAFEQLRQMRPSEGRIAEVDNLQLIVCIDHEHSRLREWALGLLGPSPLVDIQVEMTHLRDAEVLTNGGCQALRQSLRVRLFKRIARQGHDRYSRIPITCMQAVECIQVLTAQRQCLS